MTDATSKPTPDPTILTTEQLLREIKNATDRLETRIEGFEEVVDERFKSVEKQFTLVESRRVEQKADTEKAVQAALSAAKEALWEQTAASDKSITKSETAMSEQVRQMVQTFTTAIKGSTDAIVALTTRVERIENIKQGGKETVAALYALAGFLVSLIIVGGILAAYIGTH